MYFTRIVAMDLIPASILVLVGMGVVFALLFWSYVVSGPAGAAREKLRASLTTLR